MSMVALGAGQVGVFLNDEPPSNVRVWLTRF
jgi:hypothetical protein